MAGSSPLQERVAELREQHRAETRRQLVLAALDRGERLPTAKQLDAQLEADYQPPDEQALARLAGREFLAAVAVAERELQVAQENLAKVPDTVAKLKDAAQAKLDSAAAIEAETQALAEQAAVHLEAMRGRVADLPPGLAAELSPVTAAEQVQAHAQVAQVNTQAGEVG